MAIGSDSSKPMTACRNLITDVPGLRVGNAEGDGLLTGVTVLIPDQPVVAAIDIRGGGPGTRETAVLGLSGTVQEAHAIVLSGGSAFGLAAATSVQSWLAEKGVGFAVRNVRIPIVPQAVLFDLLNGQAYAPNLPNPYEALGRKACERASADIKLGSAGAGMGATTATLRGGLGSASCLLDDGLIVGALVAVNAVGSATLGASPYFWSAPFEVGREFGGRGWPTPLPADRHDLLLKGAAAGTNTTIGIVATNAILTKAEAHRLAVMAHTGLARSLYPVHTPLDGDAIFALSTGERALSAPLADLTRLGAAAATALARAVARGVYEAAPVPQNWTGPPAWRTRFCEGA